MANDVEITVILDPIVRLYCRNIKCKYNQMNNIRNRAIYCNLKEIEIDENGTCLNQETLDKSFEEE
jgi:hypothetical protein